MTSAQTIQYEMKVGIHGITFSLRKAEADKRHADQ